MSRPKLLDLFCGAGGAAMGYHRAGFDVVGVDTANERRYPFEFHRGDALEFLEAHGREFDVIHASPPCQTFSRTRHLRVAQGKGTSKVDLVHKTRGLLVYVGRPYVIENVPGAPLMDPVTLCGSMFGLKVRRHRLFEAPSVWSLLPKCDHRRQGRPVGVYGSMRDDIPQGGRTARSLEEAQEAMGIDWMLWGDLVEAIPPAYTEWIGRQLMGQLEVAA